METEGSLPHSQVPATCPYPVPHQSIPLPHIPYPEYPYYYYYYYYYYYPPIHDWVFQVAPFPQVYPTNCTSTPHITHRSHSSWFITQKILDEEYRSHSSSLCKLSHLLPHSCQSQTSALVTLSRSPKPSDFSGRKNPQHAFLRKGSKAVCPMS